MTNTYKALTFVAKVDEMRTPHEVRPNDHHILTTYFAYPDGEPIKLYVKQTKNRYLITDNGHTIRYLRNQMLDLEQLEDAIDMIVTEHICELHPDEYLFADTEITNFQDIHDIEFVLSLTLCQLVQTIIEVCALQTSAQILDPGEFSDEND